jgi:4-amino-4-deoxy-L-arabinose transferase-like glycosyltransferase
VNRASCLEIAAVLLILAASLVLRLLDLDAFIASDELRWTCRSIGFREALRQQDWSSTFRVGHPGVITTWLGALFIPHDDAQAVETCRATDDAKNPETAGDTPAEQTERLRELGRLLFAGRTGVALATWLCVGAIYLLARLIWGPKIALVGLILVAFDPFYLAHSRFIHLDALLASTMVLSVLSFLVSRQSSRSNRWRTAFVVLSGGIAGLACLQKSPALFLAPFVALVLVADVLRRGVSCQTVLGAVRDLALWGLVAGIVYVTLWPAMWSDPLGTLGQVLDTAIGYAEEGHEPGNFFMGRPVHDPGWAFYPVATLFRMTPLTLLGLIGGLVGMARSGKEGERRFGLAILLLYSLLFGVFMGLGKKMFDRYLLPIFPPLEIVAAAGLVWMGEALWVRLSGKLRSILSVELLVSLSALAVCLALVLPHHPYYLTYYNPLLGGSPKAREVLLMGWGEGYGEAAAYLNAQPNAQELQATVPGFPVFAALFRGETRDMRWYSIWESDYVLAYISQVQRERDKVSTTEYYNNPNVQPEYVVTLHGVDYVWIYRNEHYVEPLRYLEEHGQPAQGECLLVNGDSLIAENYRDELPVYALHAQWVPSQKAYIYWSAEQVAALVDDMARNCRKVWYVRYPEYEGETYLDVLRARAVLLERATFPHVEIGLYRLVEREIEPQQLDLRFGSLHLRGYGSTDPSPAWERDGGVVLEWETLQPLQHDYSVFLHLYDGHGQRVAQADSLVIDQSLHPTSQWEPGVSSSVLYHISIPPGIPPGTYELELGVYLFETGERLALAGSGEEAVRLGLEVGIPDEQPPVSELAIPHPVERDVIPELRLLGYDLESDAAVAGEPVTLRLYWQALADMAQAYRLQLALQGVDGEVYWRAESGLVHTDYPTTEWQPGELLHDLYPLPTDAVTATGEVTVTLNLLDEQDRPLLDRPVELARLWVQSLQPSFDVPSTIDRTWEVSFDDKIALLGYELDSGPVKPGESFHLKVYWQARREMEKNYKVFVHLYDEAGNILAQRDRMPGLGVRLTSGWQVGEVIADRFTVPVGSEVPPGRYHLAVGLYDEGTGERLAAYGPDGERLPQERVLLGEVQVEP